MDVRVPSWRAALAVAAVSSSLTLALAPAPAAAVTAPARVTVTAVGPTSAHPGLLKRGSTGPYVKFVQRTLGVKRTGYYGRQTKAAVKQFQTASSLRVTGRVNKRTWGALQRKALADTASRGTTTATSDPTMSALMRKSQATRKTLAFEIWLTSEHGKAITRRESGGRCKAVSPSGAYRGKWQMGEWFWENYGGLKFAPTPDQATCLEQDRIAYKGWIDSWWNPWGG